ncbi:hypothetical protein ACFSHQ_19630 [Gemmobacter lanyuensis]
MPKPRSGNPAPALRAMGEEGDLTWVLLPGNHDSLAATELWRRIHADGPANLRVMTDPTPKRLRRATGSCLRPAHSAVPAAI